MWARVLGNRLWHQWRHAKRQRLVPSRVPSTGGRSGRPTTGPEHQAKAPCTRPCRPRRHGPPRAGLPQSPSRAVPRSSGTRACPRQRGAPRAGGNKGPEAIAGRANTVGAPCARRASVSEAKERSPARREKAIRRGGRCARSNVPTDASGGNSAYALGKREGISRTACGNPVRCPLCALRAQRASRFTTAATKSPGGADGQRVGRGCGGVQGA